jgi:hypothetical protein
MKSSPNKSIFLLTLLSLCSHCLVWLRLSASLSSTVHPLFPHPNLNPRVCSTHIHPTSYLWPLFLTSPLPSQASLCAQGKRRYDRKQAGFGGQTKPVFKKKVRLSLDFTYARSSLCPRVGQD